MKKKNSCSLQFLFCESYIFSEKNHFDGMVIDLMSYIDFYDMLIVAGCVQIPVTCVFIDLDHSVWQNIAKILENSLQSIYNAYFHLLHLKLAEPLTSASAVY